MQTIAFTGHRPNKLNNDYELKSPFVLAIKDRIINLVQNTSVKGHVQFVVGMALGIDTLAAKIAVEFDIPFIAAIPDASQADRWPKESQTVYYRLLDKAFKVVNVSQKTNFKIEHLQLRNEWMVNQLTGDEDYLLAVWDGTPGGTRNCIMYAKSKSKEIKRIDPKLILV